MKQETRIKQMIAILLVEASYIMRKGRVYIESEDEKRRSDAVHFSIGFLCRL